MVGIYLCTALTVLSSIVYTLAKDVRYVPSQPGSVCNTTKSFLSYISVDIIVVDCHKEGNTI
jgi:hypothetical protein